MREKERQVIPPCKLSNLPNRLASLCVYFSTPLVNVISRIYTSMGDGRLFYKRNTLLALTFSDTDESMLVYLNLRYVNCRFAERYRAITDGKRKAASDKWTHSAI